VSRRLSSTVAVCTRNRPGPLQDCLASIAVLDPAPDAVIVVDQSDPAEAERVRALSSSPVRYVQSEPRGLGFARQTAFLHCATEVLLFTDDDCLVRPQWAGALGEVFSVHHTAGGSVGACRPHPAHPLPAWAPAWITEWGDDEPQIFRHPADPATIGGGLNMGFRVSAIREIGGFDPRFGPGAPLRNTDDADSLHRVMRAGWAVVYAPDAVVSHSPPRDRSAHEANEHSYAFGLGAWSAVASVEGDDVPTRWWWDAFRRALERSVRCAPFDGPRATVQRLRVALELCRGRWVGTRAARRPFSIGEARAPSKSAGPKEIPLRPRVPRAS
jgi:GT2 family glycosyltransferase